MSWFRLAVVHAWAQTLELARHPAYVVPTLALPSLFFLFFAGSAPAGAAATMAGFAAFAAIGVAFFQFGVGIAGERASPWELYVRTLPVSSASRLAARLMSAAVFAAAAAGLVLVLGAVLTPVSLTPARWAALLATLAAGTIPFALFGIALGYWAPPRGALPIANLLYLGLSYAGGLWLRPQRLPAPVRFVSPYLPTRALADATVASASGMATPWGAYAALALFAAAFAAFASWGYRRDEGVRYR